MSVDELYKKFDVDEALKATRSEPENAAVWWTAGSVLSSHGRYAEAATSWQRAAELGGKHDAGPAFYNAGNDFLRVPDPASAMAMYERAAEAGFDAIDALIINTASALAIQQGQSASGERDRRGAEARLADKWSIPDQWANFGDYWDRLVGNRERAASAFERAIALDADANMGEWWFQLAEQRVALGDVRGAATAYQAGIDLGHPEWPNVEVSIASAQGSGDALLTRLQQAAATDEDLFPYVVTLLSGLGRSNDAIAYGDEHVRSSATSNTTRDVILYALAEDALRRRQPSEALSRLDAVVGPDDEAKFLRVRALLELDRLDEAQTLLAPFEPQGIRAPVKFRLLLAICRSRRGEPVDEALFEDVKPLPEWVVRLRR